MGEKNKEVLGRIGRLEQQVSDLSSITKEIKDMLKTFATENKPNAIPEKEVRGVPYVSDANPWALETSKTISETRKMRDFISSARIDTYKVTLKALKDKGDWLSAAEVGEITKRRRNTESTYLNRLYRAGLVEQKSDGNKALYKYCDEQATLRLFGKI